MSVSCVHTTHKTHRWTARPPLLCARAPNPTQLHRPVRRGRPTVLRSGGSGAAVPRPLPSQTRRPQSGGWGVAYMSLAALGPTSKQRGNGASSSLLLSSCALWPFTLTPGTLSVVHDGITQSARPTMPLSETNVVQLIPLQLDPVLNFASNTGGVGWHKASVSDCLPLAAHIGLSPLHIPTLCGPEHVGGGGPLGLERGTPPLPTHCWPETPGGGGGDWGGGGLGRVRRERLGGGGVRHKASVFGCLPLAAPIDLSPLLILTLCGPEHVLVVSTEPPDDWSCLTTPGSIEGGGGVREEQ